MFEKINEKFNKDIGKEVASEIRDNIPTSLDQKDIEVISSKIESSVEKRIAELRLAAKETEDEVSGRIEALADTTSDLKQIPLLGSIGLFLRGIQRPVWGFMVLYIDLMVFSEEWMIEEGLKSSTFLAVNILVLGFLFGERAIKNVLPLFSRYMNMRKGF